MQGLTFVGPNEVTVFGLDAYNTVHGSDSQCGRAAYYDIVHPMVSLDTTRDEKIHAYRRKVWDQAFSIKCEWAARSPDLIGTMSEGLTFAISAREGNTCRLFAGR